MQATRPSIAKEESIFGVCAALGQDFGFNPLYLRLTLGGLLLWNPLAMFGTYAFAGLLVVSSRWLFPDPRTEANAPQIDVDLNTRVHGAAAQGPQERETDGETVELAHAA